MAQIRLYEQPSFEQQAADGMDPASAPRKQWRSLEELNDPSEFQQFLEQHPRQAALFHQSKLNRRTFLKMSGAALALLGVTGCNTRNRPPGEAILPYVEMPEEVVPGIPLFFASTMTLGGYARGVLIETHEGRPTRVEGNPLHPASLGSSDVYTGASMLDLYDPDRSVDVLESGSPSSWDDFSSALAASLDEGTSLHILTETVTSPTLADQLASLQAAFPNAGWHQYEPMGYDAAVTGAELAFGQAVNTVYHFDQAQTILSLDADFLMDLPGSLHYARDFIARRKVSAADDSPSMSRLYVVESTPSNTGVMADERLPLRASAVEGFTRALARALGINVRQSDDDGWDAAWLETVVSELQANAGASLVVAGATQSPVVHAIAHAINSFLGNVGTTVTYIEPVVAQPVDQGADLSDLVAQMSAGAVDVLVMIGGNPVYNAPADLGFADALAQVPMSVHLSMYVDETSQASTWHLPQSHYVEAWGDARAFDGTASLAQPPIGPLYETTRSAYQLLALLQGDERSDYEIVRDYWSTQLDADGFEAAWQRALHDGVVPDSAAPEIETTLEPMVGLPVSERAEGLEVVFRLDPSIWDGRFAGNSWLQELPKPLSKITWDNVALISPAMGSERGLTSGDLIELTVGGASVTAPVWILPGQADESITVSLGYGRTSAGIGSGVGFDAYPLRTTDALWFVGGAELSGTGERHVLASTQRNTEMIGSEDPVEVMTLAAFLSEPEYAESKDHSEVLSFYADEFISDGPSWGMSIDLTACIGCNGCTIACQSENNVPTVGKEQVLNEREMHWIRVDRYYEGDAANPRTYFQPVACVHCEQAPCEVVCPVQATVHSYDGLNQMVYNRCIGTRYCSANCPYGVRRFNFLDYIDDDPIWEEMRNPDVTVRARGVMEKCTYCVQRINRVKIAAGNQNRSIEDGEIVPACAAACPTQAIVFGDINDPESQVVKAKSEPHDYGLLAKLNTLPRTTYLARIYNPSDGSAES